MRMTVIVSSKRSAMVYGKRVTRKRMPTSEGFWLDTERSTDRRGEFAHRLILKWHGKDGEDSQLSTRDSVDKQRETAIVVVESLFCSCQSVIRCAFRFPEHGSHARVYSLHVSTLVRRNGVANAFRPRR